MKRREQIDFSRLKYQIKDPKNANKNWRLNKEQITYIQNVLGRDVVESLYEINTKHFDNIRKVQSKLLKDLHFAHKRGKKTIVRSALTSDQKALLRSVGVYYRPIKYKIK